ncbi:MAG TPA: bifunctional transaldolase/phosoglucose isomerase [Anaerolineaceae bacterium]
MNAIDQLHRLGQSIWYDNIQRKLLESGELKEMIDRGEIRGVTSNPSIFNNAISKSTDYDPALIPMAWAGWSAEDIFYQLAVEDIQAAADLFSPLYEQTNGGDGYVSLEVNPFLARDTNGTIEEAQRLWERVSRPNLMIKIPATKEGLPAITAALARGINVNVTLIFSLDRYVEVMDAFLSGLEQRAAAGLPIDRIASVASFFVSRLDTKIDARLAKMAKENPNRSAEINALAGKAAIANARLAYHLFKATFSSERFAKLETLGARFQRPLWASTSTKNPAYRDVIYIEELIGTRSINTVPPQTLSAFKDHGIVRNSLEEGVHDAWKTLADLEGLGISLKQVTDELEEEGVKAFADAFEALLHSITSKVEVIVRPLGSLKEKIANRIARLEKEQFSARMFSHDPTLWTLDPDGQSEVRKRLGWLQAPEEGLKRIDELQAFALECQKAGFTHALLLGMGGSSLAPEVMRLTFGIGKIGEGRGLDLRILDSTDPVQVAAAKRWAPAGKTLFIVSSKSGTTGEINAFFDYFWDISVRRHGKRAGKYFIAITDPGTVLEKIAHERSFRRIFPANPEVGGRYSALIEFGLVPAALLGIDLSRFLQKAHNISRQCLPEIPVGRNPGVTLGAIFGEAALNGKDKLTILSDPEFWSFGSWLEQLIAESSGKIGKGIVPVDIEPLAKPSLYKSDRLFVYLRKNGSLDDTVKEIIKAGRPVVTLPMSDLYDLPAEMYRWEIAIATACSIIGVNAFDQPDVQDAKTRTLAKIAEFRELKRLKEDVPAWEGEGGQVFGWNMPGLNGAKTLADVVNIFLAHARTGDYIAINAYVPRNEQNLKRLQRLRKMIQEKTELATTLGFGPRFLHSTGQLHKGGADNGMFLEITYECSKDMDIPNQGLSFGVLERAQALGDLEALRARNRRVIRVHLTNGKIADLISK